MRHGPDTLAIEVKTWRVGGPDPVAQGLEQLDRYLAGLGLTSGWLVIFDQRPGLPPIPERTEHTVALTPERREVVVIRA